MTSTAPGAASSSRAFTSLRCVASAGRGRERGADEGHSSAARQAKTDAAAAWARADAADHRAATAETAAREAAERSAHAEATAGDLRVAVARAQAAAESATARPTEPSDCLTRPVCKIVLPTPRPRGSPGPVFVGGGTDAGNVDVSRSRRSASNAGWRAPSWRRLSRRRRSAGRRPRSTTMAEMATKTPDARDAVSLSRPRRFRLHGSSTLRREDRFHAGSVPVADWRAAARA